MKMTINFQTKARDLTVLLSLLLLFSVSCSDVENNISSDDAKKSDALLSLKSSGAHWGYDGHEGPEHWGELSPEYILCAEGLSQSPINLKTCDIEEGSDSELEFFYTSCQIEMVNNGHTIMGTPLRSNYLELAGDRYDLVQFHFHAPSEHAVNDNLLPIEVHFVHVNAEGKLLVVGVLVKRGKKNKNYAPIWANLPEHANEVRVVKKRVRISSLLPKDKSIYNYSGSLTTPPCSEGVNWNVMVKKVQMSEGQINAFEEIYDHNNRPVLPLNGREVVEKEYED